MRTFKEPAFVSNDVDSQRGFESRISLDESQESFFQPGSAKREWNANQFSVATHSGEMSGELEKYASRYSYRAKYTPAGHESNVARRHAGLVRIQNLLVVQDEAMHHSSHCI
jgi:hypothetical protein